MELRYLERGSEKVLQYRVRKQKMPATAAALEAQAFATAVSGVKFTEWSAWKDVPVVAGSDDIARRAQMTDDEKRLLWIARESGIDGFGKSDIHEEAAVNAALRGRDAEPTDLDYVAAIRRCIDSNMRHYGDNGGST